jgi:hypothetical protein
MTSAMSFPGAIDALADQFDRLTFENKALFAGLVLERLMRGIPVEHITAPGMTGALRDSITTVLGLHTALESRPSGPLRDVEERLLRSADELGLSNDDDIYELFLAVLEGVGTLLGERTAHTFMGALRDVVSGRHFQRYLNEAGIPSAGTWLANDIWDNVIRYPEVRQEFEYQICLLSTLSKAENPTIETVRKDCEVTEPKFWRGA